MHSKSRAILFGLLVGASRPFVVASQRFLSEWSVSSKQTRPMDAVTNTFCAVGALRRSYLPSRLILPRGELCLEMVHGSTWEETKQ